MRMLLFLSFLVAAPYLQAQQSMFESGDGKTALYLRQPAAAVNFGDSKASIAYVHDLSTNKYILGAAAYATANSGISSLFFVGQAQSARGWCGWADRVPVRSSPSLQ